MVLLFTFTIGSIISCKKEAVQEQKNSNTKDVIISDEKTSAIIAKSEALRKKCTSTTSLNKTEGTVYEIDSALCYLSVALSIQLANADCYTIEQDVFTIDLDSKSELNTINDARLASYFSQMVTFAETSLASVDNPNKAIDYIKVERLPVDQSIIRNRVIGTIRISRKVLNNARYSFLKTMPIDWFKSNESWRFNFNGGNCSQPYSELDWTGPRGGQGIDHAGNYLGYTTGGAKVLENAINSSYAARVAPRPLVGLATSVPIGYKLIYLPATSINNNTRLLPWDYRIANSGFYPYGGAVKHSPTRIFSFHDWDLTKYHKLICLNGDMLDYYLNESMTILDSWLSTHTFAPGRLYFGMEIYSNRKDMNLPPSNIIVQDLNGQVPHTWGVPAASYYEYFRHEYKPLQTQPALVVDPNSL